MTNNKKILFIILLILLVCGILVVFVFDFNCIFKEIFAIPCPGCGLTRAFRAIFTLDFLSAFRFNISSIPLFLFLLILGFLFVYDFLKKSNYAVNYLLFFRKRYVFVIILVLISWIVNIFREV